MRVAADTVITYKIAYIEEHKSAYGFCPDFTDTLGQRRKFSVEYKREAVVMLESPGVSIN
jgi:hypothetical protein